MIRKTLTSRGIGIAIVLFGLLIMVQGLTAADQPSQEKENPKGSEMNPHRIPMLDQKIKLDGVADEEAWKKALKLTLKYEVSPGENIPAQVSTEVLLYTTKTHINVAFICHDPKPSEIRAQLRDRDTLYQDDFVGLLLDPFNDKRRRFNLFCNPLGMQADFTENTSSQMIEWDPIWKSAGKINESGYIVEMEVPFSSLRFPGSKKEKIWFFDLTRRYPRDVPHNLRLVKFDRNNPCYICQGEHMVGFKGIGGEDKIELAPTLTAVYTQERDGFPDGEMVKKDSSVDPGITARWNITPNITLGATINPDFSNVEADVAQLDINTQYALYYDEKRPFFLEGASLFASRLPVVYTRTLAEPKWGIKLTGKTGKSAFGLYSVQDDITNIFIPTPTRTYSTSSSMESLGTVLRYRRDIFKTSTVGLVVTDREGDDYFNRLAGFDLDLRLSTSDQLLVQALASQTQYPDDISSAFGQSTERLDGTAVDVYYSHSSRNLGFHTVFRDVSADFRADLGFVTQAGYRLMGGGFEYKFLRDPGHWYTEIDIGPSFEYETDEDDNLLRKQVQFSTTYKGPAQSLLMLNGVLGKQYYMGEIFDINNVVIYGQMQPSAQLELLFYSTFGDHIDLDNIRQAKRFQVNGAFSYKLGRHITLNLDHVIERLTVNSLRLYTANVTNFKFIYQFSKRAFLRTNLQYVDYDFNVDNYLFQLDPAYKKLFTKILFSYKVNPRTMLFLGYSDNHFGSSQIKLTQADRTFFLKIGYALGI